MACLRKTVMHGFTVALAIAALVSLALALLATLDDIRRPKTGRINVQEALRADTQSYLTGSSWRTWALFPVDIYGEVWNGPEWTVDASARGGAVHVTWYGKRCLCGEFRPNHAVDCRVRKFEELTRFASVTYGYSPPAIDTRIEALGVHWRKGSFLNSGFAEFSISFWTLLALFAPYPVLVFHRWRGHRHRRCLGFCSCGYDLTGNVSGRCPECGTAVPIGAEGDSR